MICPHCQKEVPDEVIAAHLGSKGGKVKSDAKAKASRENGKKGWKPKNVSVPANH